jgi:CheY-like chemotaxis protein
VLVAAGAVVEKADSAARGLEKICAFRPQVLVSDVGMPGEDGYWLARALRAQPAGADVPLVAITGFAGREDAERAVAAGFTRHVAKPIDPARFAELLADLHRARRPPLEAAG